MMRSAFRSWQSISLFISSWSILLQYSQGLFWYTLLLCIGALVASILVARYLPDSARGALDPLVSHRTLLIIMLVLVAVTIFAALASITRNLALGKTDEVRRGGVLITVGLTFKDPVNYPPRLLKAASEGGLMKLIQTKDRIFVILQPGQTDDLLGSAFSYSVALSDVSVVDVKLDRTVARASGDSAGQ